MLSYKSYHAEYENDEAWWRQANPNRFGSDFLVGVELEVELRLPDSYHEDGVYDAAVSMRSDIIDRVGTLVNDANPHGDYWLAEQDGSINEFLGIEFISSPIPYERLLDPDGAVIGLLNQLKDVTGEQRDNAGIHFNLNGNAYTEDEQAAIIWFFNTSSRLCKAVAGRSSSYARFGLMRYGYLPDHKYHSAWGGSRTRTGRIEVRICKSTTNIEEFTRKATFVLSAAQFAAENADLLRQLDASNHSYWEIENKLYISYMNWLSDKKSSNEQALFNWLKYDSEPLVYASLSDSDYDRGRYWDVMKRTPGMENYW